jgi:hypothetical protein
MIPHSLVTLLPSNIPTWKFSFLILPLPVDLTCRCIREPQFIRVLDFGPSALVSRGTRPSGLAGEKCFRNLVHLLNSKLGFGFIYWSHLQGIWWFISIDRSVTPSPGHLSHYPEYDPAFQWYFFTGVFLLALVHIISCLYNRENYTKISIYSCNLRGLLCVCVCVLYLCILIQVHPVPLHLCLPFHLRSCFTGTITCSAQGGMEVDRNTLYLASATSQPRKPYISYPKYFLNSLFCCNCK